MTHRTKAITLAVASCLGACPALAQLRIATYNIASASNNDAIGAGMSTVLSAMGSESYNGIARPLDVLTIQETTSQSTTTQQFVNMLNTIYGAGTYARGSLD